MNCEICGARLTQEEVREYDDLCAECVLSPVVREDPEDLEETPGEFL